MVSLHLETPQEIVFWDLDTDLKKFLDTGKTEIMAYLHLIFIMTIFGSLTTTIRVSKILLRNSPFVTGDTGEIFRFHR